MSLQFFPFGFQNYKDSGSSSKILGQAISNLFSANGGADVLYSSYDIPRTTTSTVTNRGSASGANGTYINGDSSNMTAVDEIASRTFAIRDNDTRVIQVSGYSPSIAGITTPLCCGAWVKFDEINKDSWIIRQQTEVVLRRRGDSKLEYILNSFTGATDRAISNTAIKTGEWYFVVGNYAGGSNPIEIWLDGVLEGSQIPTGTYGTTGALEIGRTGANTNVEGSFDLVFMRKSAISLAQIQAIYNATKDRYKRAITSPYDPIGVQIWLDANDISSMTDDGGGIISLLRDKTNSSRNASASTTARPTLVLNAQNGKNVLRANGSNFMTIASSVALLNEYTIYLICRTTDLATDQRMLAQATTTLIGINGTSTPDKLIFRASNAGGIDLTTRNWTVGTNYAVLVFARDSANKFDTGQNISTLSREFSDVAQPGTLTISEIIGRTDGFRLTGDFCELLIFNRRQTQTEIDNAIAFFKNKWGT